MVATAADYEPHPLAAAHSRSIYQITQAHTPTGLPGVAPAPAILYTTCHAGY